MVTTDGSTAYATEYGTLYTSSPLFTVDVSIVSGIVRVNVTPASATSTKFNTIAEPLPIPA